MKKQRCLVEWDDADGTWIVTIYSDTPRDYPPDTVTVHEIAQYRCASVTTDTRKVLR